MFGLMHQRLPVVVPPPPAYLDPLPFDGEVMSDSHAAFDPDVAAAGVTITIKQDGTWIMEKTHQVFGSPVTGDWAAVPSPSVGNDFSVWFELTDIGADGSPWLVIYGFYDTWLPLTGDQNAGVGLEITSNDSKIVDYEILVKIRNNLTMEIVQGTITLNVSADQEA